MNTTSEIAAEALKRIMANRAAANQANAQLSTGPKTEEGKSASSKNAFKRGFTSARIWVYEDEHEDFDRLHKGLLESLKPVGELEKFQFDIVLQSSWIVEQIMSEEATLLSKGALVNPEMGKHLDRLNRYRRNHERSMRQAMAELRRLQSERLFRRESQQFLGESVLPATRPILIATRKLVRPLFQLPRAA